MESKKKGVEFIKPDDGSTIHRNLIVLFISTLGFSVSFSLNSIISLFVSGKSNQFQYTVFLVYIVLIFIFIAIFSTVFNLRIT